MKSKIWIIFMIIAALFTLVALMTALLKPSITKAIPKKETEKIITAVEETKELEGFSHEGQRVRTAHFKGEDMEVWRVAYIAPKNSAYKEAEMIIYPKMIDSYNVTLTKSDKFDDGADIAYFCYEKDEIKEISREYVDNKFVF